MKVPHRIQRVCSSWNCRVLWDSVQTPSRRNHPGGIPEWDTAEREVQAHGNLILHLVPVSHHITAPADGAITPNTETAASGHLERTLYVALHRSLVLVDALVVQQWKAFFTPNHEPSKGLIVLHRPASQNDLAPEIWLMRGLKPIGRGG